MVLNYVFSDVQGNIGWRVSGVLPIRAWSDGSVPRSVTDGDDDWLSWIPYAEMPHATNPDRGWLGTANHRTISEDYGYYFSSIFAPSYRYRRLSQLLDPPVEKTVDDHWQYQRDTKNLMAREDTAQMGRALSDWSFMGEMIFQRPRSSRLFITGLLRWSSAMSWVQN